MPGLVRGATGEPPAPRYRMKDLPLDDRPREKLLRLGAAALSDAELIALLVRTGTGKRSALDIAHEILRNGKNLRGIAGKSPAELMRLIGIGVAKAVELSAAFELGRRVQGSAEDERRVVKSPEDVLRLMQPRMRDLSQELFYVMVLDAKNSVREVLEISRGTLNASLVHPREVFKAAIDHRAASIIVVHNHPSGNPEPSREDVEITAQLADAGRIVGIPLHDHLILAGDRYTSFAERGLLG
jgi:DNA repair protein RadC